jgi:Na+-translocating ferredoxin:NAD+ oxidoreductase RnfA subunit
MILVEFPRMCSYLSVSSELQNRFRPGKAVTLVMSSPQRSITCLRYVIVPLDLVYLQYNHLHHVIAALRPDHRNGDGPILPDLHIKRGSSCP